MSHIDPDELSVIALGEPANPADEQHLAECARCRSRLDQLAAVVASSRAVTEADRPITSPDSVWSAISAELDGEDSSKVMSLDAARRRRAPRILVAAAAVIGLLAGSVITSVVVQRDGATTDSSIVASTNLEPVQDADVRGTAIVERTQAGAVLRVSIPDLPLIDDGYYEVWMATADAATMVAVGTLNPGHDGTFVLPVGMEVSAFPLVDVSVEHFDGDATHSVTSVVRGQLPV